MNATAINIGRKKLNLSNLDKPLYPSGFTKAQVIDYYVRIAPYMLPHLRGRAVTLKRYPDGSDKDYFYEKNCPLYRPSWMRTAKVPSTRSKRGDSVVNHCVIDDEASLVWAANLASIELHVPMAKANKPGQPTAVVFDLDPGAPATILDCAKLALRMRDALKRLGLQSFVKTSGNKGLHLYIPLNTKCTSDDAKDFARVLAEHFAAESPREVTATMTKSLRHGKVFVDWSQNDQHKTTVCAYSLRATPQPLVSAPITWDELDRAPKRRAAAAALQFTADKTLARANKHGDLFAGLLKLKQQLPLS